MPYRIASWVPPGWPSQEEETSEIKDGAVRVGVSRCGGQSAMDAGKRTKKVRERLVEKTVYLSHIILRPHSLQKMSR